jgi:hypothetical protein
VSEHQLDEVDVHVVGMQPRRALMSKVVPVQIDLPQLHPVPFGVVPPAASAHGSMP